MRALHMWAVMVLAVLAVRVPVLGVDGAVLEEWNRQASPWQGARLPEGAFTAGFVAFALVQAGLLAVRSPPAAWIGATLALAALLGFLGAVDLEAVRVASAPLVRGPGFPFRAGQVALALVGAGVFLGLAEWGTRKARVHGPLLIWVVVLMARIPGDLAHHLRRVQIGEENLLQLVIGLWLATVPLLLAGAILLWRGVSPHRRLGGLPLGRPDGLLLVAAILGLPPILAALRQLPSFLSDLGLVRAGLSALAMPSFTALSPMVASSLLGLTVPVAPLLAIWLVWRTDRG
ncbi:MAG: hypothetical protein Q8P41_29095 [Pseudomonadota bacterium]|nr:hypothetical protein [Pseudomonadota bacterium]